MTDSTSANPAIECEVCSEPTNVGLFVLGQRFRECQLLANDQGSATYHCVDDLSGKDVIVKAFPLESLPQGTLMRLEHDALQLSRISSEWLPPLLKSGREDGAYYLVYEYITGISLQDRLRSGPLKLEEGLIVAKCLLSGLRDMHRQGVFHRGVRPSNIIINGDGNLKKATLVNFGPARNLHLESALSEHAWESVIYVSPEQSGSIDHDVAKPSDLYSAGVVLFHCLAGHPPFQSENVSSMLFEHMTARVPELRTMGVVVPRVLDEVLQRLLHKDPRDRYQTTEAALADVDAILSGLENGETDPTVVVGANDRRFTLTEPAFVARENEMRLLDEQIHLARKGRGGLVLLEGESGGGKTRLLSEIAKHAILEGLSVFRGQGISEVARQPLHMIHSVLESFLSARTLDAAGIEMVKNRLGESIDAVCAVLPELSAVLNYKPSQNMGPESFGETRTIQALSGLFDAFGSADQPALLIFDDCQWADELTYKLFRRWQDNEAAAGNRHVLVIAAFRSEEVSEDHLLRKTHPTARLRLSSFTPAAVRQLLESMAGRLPEQVIEVVTRFAHGSPFMGSAILRGMVETGALVAGTQGWVVEPLAMDDIKSSSHAAAFLTRRLNLLPFETIRLLSSGAILGKEFDLNTAAALTEQSSAQAVVAIDEARRRRLVWFRPDEARCVFVHDKIRSALLDQLTIAQRRDLHRRTALYLQENAPRSASDLAYHFDAAGESESALKYALQAVEQSRFQHALEIAEQQYRIAQRSARHADNSVKFQIAEGLGDVLMLRGHYDEAGELFEAAAKVAEGSFAEAKIRGKMGELAFKRGDPDLAFRNFEISLRKLGKFVPKRVPVYVLLLLWELFVQFLHTVFPRFFVHRLKRLPNDAERLTLTLFDDATHGAWYCRSKIVCLWAHLRGMNLAERYLPTLELASAYSLHAPVMTLVPYFSRAIAYSEKSLEIRKSFGDLWGQGQSLCYYGCVLYAASRFVESIEKCREAVRLLSRMGDYWQVHIARYQIAASHYHLGHLQDAIEESKLNHKSGLELGDEQASGIILDVWARAEGGRLPKEILHEEIGRKRSDVQGRSQVALAQGVYALSLGKLDRATAILEKAVKEVNQAGICNAYTLPLLAWLTTAWRIRAEEASKFSPRGRRATLRTAEKTARRALRASRLCRNDWPQTYRELALILAMQGETQKALSAFEKSLKYARQFDARYQYALTLLAREQLCRELNKPGSEKDRAEAQFILAELHLQAPSPNTEAPPDTKSVSLSLYDRFDTILVMGRKIASALTGTTIFEETRNAALRLLRAERCQVLQILGDAKNFRLIPVAGEIEGAVDENLARSAILAEKAIASDADSVQHPGANVNDHGKQSTLCVPLFVRGRAVACLYVVHQHIQKLFGPNEERVADFIATIAGAALENSEGFKQLQQLNATLEQRVVERTAAAESRARELALSNRELERVASELLQTQAQLHVAMQSANTANHAKSRFLATMSHEIRTPMNGILGMVELTLATSLTGQQRNYLTALKDSANLLLEIINDILDFSKIEAGKMELESIPCDVHKTVDDVARLLAVSASKKDLELVCRIDPRVPREVLGDPKRLRQIVVNLVGNAIKFTDRGEVLVRVAAEHASEMKTRLHFTVRDTGIGIAADKIDHIFEAFRQSDSSVTRRFGGTGLGLSISSQLVELMGGQIWVESEPSRGSTFHFTVDFTLPEQPQMVLPTAPFFGNRFALIVSGNENVREYCEEILEDAGMRVRIGDNRESVLEAVATMRGIERNNESPLLLIVDAGLSRGEGFELMESLLGEDLNDWRVVMLTPTGMVDGFERCQKMGIRHCIAKPVKAAELLEAVSLALGQSAETLPVAESRNNQNNACFRVLVADDSPVNQEVASGLLELRGHSVQLADNGREALEAFRKGSFDVILMDLEMPEMDGLTAAMRIRDLEQATGGRVPILAMTAHVLNSVEAQCLEAGMDGYISKPIQPMELYQALDKYCSKPSFASSVAEE